MELTEKILLTLRLTRRELRSGLRGFGVFLTCLFLGVFAISAIGSFTESAKSGLLADAGALLGGDIEIRLAHRELPEEVIDFLSKEGALSHVVTMRTMVVDSAGDQRVLSELKAVDAAYPLYGQLGIDPGRPATTTLNGDNYWGALAEMSLMTRLNLKVGDKVQIGSAEIEITGVITTEPDRTIRAFNLGPRIMISHESLRATGLLQPGSLIYHAYRLRLPDREKVDELKLRLQENFPEAGWRIRTWRESAPRVKFFLDRMNQNLTLIGLCALLVGGLGVSGAVRGYLTSKINHIATMKCLGAPRQLVFSAYLTQVLFLGALGSGGGILCGASVPFLLDMTLGAYLPVPLSAEIHWHVLLTAALFGLLIAMVFSLNALGSSTNVSPAILFRGYSESSLKNSGVRIKLLIAIAVTCLALLAIYTSSDKKLAFWFVCGAAVCFGVFRLAATLVVACASKLPRPQNPSLRLGLGNIHRRGSPAASALFSLGLGLTALVIIMLVQSNLNDKISETVPNEAPSFFFLDIQHHQVDQFEDLIKNFSGVNKLERYPTLRGRITAIANVPVDQAKISQDVQWAVRGDRFLSYSPKLPPDTQIVTGDWWPDNYSGPPLVSITSDLAKGFGVDIGESLTVNVLGRDVTAKISSIRNVDWSTLELNFALIFSPGFLENAPLTNIASVHVSVEQEDVVFQTITKNLPNVSVISTKEILKNVSNTLSRIGIAFRSMAAIALLSGFLVLAGAVSADQHRRIHDAIIFKVCGATRVNIVIAFASEFLLLGLTAALVSAIVGGLAAFGIVYGLMNMSFSLHLETIIWTIVTGIVLTLILGLIGTWKALGQKPAAYLRTE